MSRRRPATFLTVLLLCAMTVSSAEAGTYEVKFCDGVSASATPASPDNRAFALAASASMYNPPVRCPTNGGSTNGMTHRNVIKQGKAAYWASASGTFAAPTGATVRQLRWRGQMYRATCEWTVAVAVPGRVVAGLQANRDCGIAGINYATEFTFAIDAPRFVLGVACGNTAGCNTANVSDSSFGGSRALMRTYSARVTVEDFSAPAFANVGGGLASGDWVRGSQPITMDAVDNVGIAATRFLVDGSQLGAEDRRCDYAYARPCPSPAAVSYHADTSTLSEGEHRVTVVAVDTAGNVGSLERTFLVDNTAPARPESVTVSGGDGWRTANGFSVSWTNPPNQNAPIVAAHYSLCPAAGGDCAGGSQSGESITSLSNLDLPGRGDYVLRVWLEDAAGNVDEQTGSDAVHLRFDDQPPRAAFEPLSAADPLALSVRVTDEHSGLAGGEIEVQRVGTSAWEVLPTTVDADRLRARIPDDRLREGEYSLRARVVDAAGNTGLAETRTDGSRARFALPLRVVTRLRVGVPRTVKMRTRRGRARKSVRLLRRVNVKLGRRVVIKGRLANRDGQPVGNQPVDVYSRAELPGASLEPLGTLTTGERGRFQYRARGVRSRVLRFVYRGTPVIRASASRVRLGVRGRSTLTASRRSVLNGGGVSFDGRVLGRPLPPGGKLLQLQAHYRGRWRTFATPRADGEGRWAYTYRFGATVGTVVYPFRAVLPRQDLYPFARGYSRTVRVTVRGV